MFQTEEDILLRKELEQVARDHPDRFNLRFTLDRPAPGKSSVFVRVLNFALSDWKQSQGFISDQMIADHLPPPGDETAILVSLPSSR